MNVYELTARYDARKSFYNKAHILETAKKIKLQSYDTVILEYDKQSKKIKFLCRDESAYTQTTMRHIREFFKQYTNGNAPTKTEVLKNVC